MTPKPDFEESSSEDDLRVSNSLEEDGQSEDQPILVEDGDGRRADDEGGTMGPIREEGGLPLKRPCLQPRQDHGKTSEIVEVLQPREEISKESSRKALVGTIA
eukprot:CAMPEP_0170484144 /NCGR_PEP_ID=MMETSP0208-20121228/3686_1 /TAXON_ID=197538 /ORGANISM="Strombidium inclinatum, Strain S3" /LENGTH=102 /DNA_ID=CAMNT_0010757417 /DNA_START=1081 /DNA_END=1389 /DNA_ORIENTATION=+